jgi:hypothetical protein
MALLEGDLPVSGRITVNMVYTVIQCIVIPEAADQSQE